MDLFNSQLQVEIEKRYGALSESLHDYVSPLSILMMKKGLIGRQAMLEKDYHAMMMQYMSAMDQMESVPQLERHCKKFLVILNNLGPLQALEGEKLMKAWQRAMNIYGFPHFLCNAPSSQPQPVSSSSNTQSLSYSKALDKGKRHKSNLSTTRNRPHNTNHWILVASISSLTVLLSILVLYYVKAKASKSEDSPSDLPYYAESVVLDVDVTESPKCVLSCDSTPRLKEMLTVLETLMDWKEFGINLGIEYHEIKKIKKENKLINDSKIKLYNYWLNADTAASWQKVINALERMQLKTLSSEIRRKYCSQTCNSDAVNS